jgi:hypothetical protein
LLSFFNFDLDIAAPECILPEFDYEYKFYGTLILPMICGVLLIMTLGCFVGYDVFIKGRRTTDKYATSRAIGSFLLILYYSYLMVTKRVLEVFNCNPAVPDDGNLYTSFTSLKCGGGGLCRCYDTTHIQSALILPSVIGILLYTLGFPLGILWIIRTNKKAIKTDQILRALDTGDNEKSNPYYFVRRRYHKMYYHFKPGKIYWIVIIIGRKCGIAAAGLLFRANPGFQLASILLVLFVAYVWQVKHQPYMSTVQRHEVILDHRMKAEQGDELHFGISKKLERHESNLQQKSRKDLTRMTALERELEEMDKEFEKKNKIHEREYFWDFNTVEQVLLSCAILVCLSGVMFESDRFANDDANRYIWQRTALTYAVILIVIFSFLYYFAVFCSEVIGYTPPWVKKCLAKRQRGAHLHMSNLVADGDRIRAQRNDKYNSKDKDQKLATSLLGGGGSEVTAELEIEMGEIRSMKDDDDGSQSTKNPLNPIIKKQGKVKKGGRRNKKKAKAREEIMSSVHKKSLEPKLKKEFGNRMINTDFDQDHIEIHTDKKSGRRYSFSNKTGVSEWLNDDDNEGGKNKDDKREKHVDSSSGGSYSAHKVTGETKLVDEEIHTDKKSGKRYSFSNKTGVTKWLNDDNKDDTNEDDKWETHVDATSGRRYSAHNITGETKWVNDENNTNEDGEWETHVDATSGRRYAAHKITGETKWM